MLKNKIQKVQNNCLRFTLNLRKFDHISAHRKHFELLDMDQRMLLHSVILMHKIVKGLAPSYLSNRIKRLSEVHNHNTRNRLALTVKKNTTAKKSNSFFGAIPKQYNIFSNNVDVSHLAIDTFKSKCKKHLLSM
jgi:hypothetical protein